MVYWRSTDLHNDALARCCVCHSGKFYNVLLIDFMTKALGLNFLQLLCRINRFEVRKYGVERVVRNQAVVAVSNGKSCPGKLVAMNQLNSLSGGAPSCWKDIEEENLDLSRQNHFKAQLTHG